MQLGLSLGYWGADKRDDSALVMEADRLGYHSVWTAEAYGSDAVTPLAYYAAKTSQIRLGTGILQMPARTPAMTAMTATTLDHLSDGRLLLGLGASGPQVVEGWHGVAYGKPLKRTREYVDVVRAMLRREAPVEYDGEYYQLPLAGGTGLGKPLKLITHPLRSDVPIYLASVGPKNVALTAEIADGWLPVFYSPEHAGEVWGDAVAAGIAASGDTAKSFDIAPSAAVAIGDDADAARNHLRATIALYVGGMGAKGKNFYAELVTRYGYGDAAETVQDAYLSGDRWAAMAAIPDNLVDAMNLVGSAEQVSDRIDVYRDAGATTLLVNTDSIDTLRALTELV
jgi:F420-dependent oxidoreductase-like protein